MAASTLMKVLGLVVLAACGASRPEPLGNAGTPAKPADPPPVLLASMPRPTLDLSGVLPDPTEEARWPLSVSAHPALEPRFNIAGALAQPGIGWIELCRMGAQNRTLSSGRDLQAYLRAWCAAANGNTADAVDQLAVLGNPPIAGMAPAIREDLANLLVQHGDADAAEKLLAKAKIEDIEIFDLLAASYFETGKYADASEINERAIDRQFRTAEASQCHRFARRVILKNPSSRAFYMMELDKLGDEASRKGKKLATDPDCKALDAQLACWIDPAARCTDYLLAQHLDAVKYARLLDLYYKWPERELSFGTWFEEAGEADRARPLEGSDRLEAAALVAAFNAIHCENKALGEIRDLTLALQGANHDPTLDPVLAQLIASTSISDPTPNPPKMKMAWQRSEPCHAITLRVP